MSTEDVFKFYPINLDNIPYGWDLTSLSFLCSHIQSGFACGIHNTKGQGVPHIRPMNISRNGELDLSFLKYVSEDKDEKRIQKGDILFNNTNSPELVGKTCLIKTTINIAYSNHMTRIKTLKGVNPAYIAYYLHILHMFGYFKYRCIKHVNQASVSIEPLSKTPITLAPENEQNRIVAKIEELFTKLDAGIEALYKAQAQLKRYRQSVLKAAVEGRLTAEWREKHLPASPYSAQASEDELESAEKLIERILKERRGKWESQQLAKYKSRGKNPPKNWKDKYKEQTPPDTTNLLELPEGWVLLTLEMISEWSNGKGLTKKQIMAGEYPVFGGNGINGYHNSYLSKSECIVVGRVGAHCGNIHVAPNKSWITDNAIYTKWISKLSKIQFVGLALSNKNLNKISGGSGQPYVSQSLLNPLQIALPSLNEQNQIIVDIMREYSIIDSIEKTIEIELKRAQSLRQSILKRAFEGKLVVQDPNDIPASALLERIKSEKSKSKKPKQMEIQ